MKLDLSAVLIATGFLVFVGGWTSPASAQVPQERKFALLIGLNEYRHPAQIPSLDYAIDDVQALAKELRDNQHYDVTVVSSDNVVRTIIVDELYKYALKVREADTFLLYFAGHGVRNSVLNRKTYWLTYDAHLDTLDSQGIRLEHLLDYIRDIKARKKLIILDHCFSGDVVTSLAGIGTAPEDTSAAPATVATPTPTAAASASAPPTGGPPAPARDASTGALHIDAGRYVIPVNEYQQQIHVDGGLIVIAAARGLAYELKSQKHGAFTAALLDACHSRKADLNNDAKLSLDELMRFVKSRLKDYARDEKATLDQEPSAFVVANALDTWTLCDLPVDNMAEAAGKIQAYSKQIANWTLKGWITDEVTQRCFEALVNWGNSVRDGTPLSDADRVIVGRIRELVDRKGPEQVRAAQLGATIEALRGSGQ